MINFKRSICVGVHKTGCFVVLNMAGKNSYSHVKSDLTYLVFSAVLDFMQKRKSLKNISYQHNIEMAVNNPLNWPAIRDHPLVLHSANIQHIPLRGRELIRNWS